MKDNILSHPREFIDPLLVQQIRSHAVEAEVLGRLHHLQLKIVHEQKWFRLFVLESLGGLGFNLLRALHIEEGLAWADGSTAWVVTLCAGAGWFSGFLDPTINERIFSDPHVCLAGSGAATGTAEQCDNGYIINGSWLHATGSMDATAFTANCVITLNGKPLHRPNGDPLIRSFIFFPDEVQLINSWNAMGMIATASHGFEVKNVHVSVNRMFTIAPEAAHINEPVYKYPFLQFAEATLAVNYAGMAQRFIDLCIEISDQRKSVDPVSKKIDASQKKLHDARAGFYRSVENSWEELTAKGHIGQTLNTVTQTSHSLYRHSLNVVHELYPLMGLRAADPRTEINRVWRNLHTASQHSLFAAA